MLSYANFLQSSVEPTTVFKAEADDMLSFGMAYLQLVSCFTSPGKTLRDASSGGDSGVLYVVLSKLIRRHRAERLLDREPNLSAIWTLKPAETRRVDTSERECS